MRRRRKRKGKKKTNKRKSHKYQWLSVKGFKTKKKT